jgi:Caspase domain
VTTAAGRGSAGDASMARVFFDPTPGAGLHALIVGVDRYPHLEGGDGPRAPNTYGMGQLTCAASTATRVFEWLMTYRRLLPYPLKSCRLLVSASPPQLAAHPPPAGFEEATLDNVLDAARDWRVDASGDPESSTLFYFAGHGVQRTREDAVALLSDFGDGRGGGILRNAISTKSIVDGMVPSDEWPEIARTQLSFVDACRLEPEEFAKFVTLEPTRVFDEVHSRTDDRRSPIYFAAAPGTEAYGVPGGLTLFGRAVLHSLSGGAAVEPEDDGDPWRVSISSLARALELQIDEIGAGQEFVAGGTWRGLNTVVTLVDGIPEVEVIVEVEPPTASATIGLEAIDFAQHTTTLPTPLRPHPYHCKWRAGYYAFTATNGGRVRTSNPQAVMPPLLRKRVKAP